VPFVVCLTNLNSFSFFVNVLALSSSPPRVWLSFAKCSGDFARFVARQDHSEELRAV
jgi:hypothetical protein